MVESGNYDLSHIKPGMKVNVTMDDINNEKAISHNWERDSDSKKGLVGHEYEVEKVDGMYAYIGGMPFFVGAIADFKLDQLRKDIATIATTGQFQQFLNIPENEKLVIIMYHNSGMTVVGYTQYPPTRTDTTLLCRYGRSIIKWGTDAHLSQLAETGPREETELGHQITHHVNMDGVGLIYPCDLIAWHNKLWS
jgi:hypothetical protein